MLSTLHSVGPKISNLPCFSVLLTPQDEAVTEAPKLGRGVPTLPSRGKNPFPILQAKQFSHELRALHNSFQESRGSLKVAAKCRPEALCWTQTQQHRLSSSQRQSTLLRLGLLTVLVQVSFTGKMWSQPSRQTEFPWLLLSGARWAFLAVPDALGLGSLCGVGTPHSQGEEALQPISTCLSTLHLLQGGSPFP